MKEIHHMQAYHLYSDGNYFPKAKKSGFGGYIASPNGEVLVEYSEQIKEKEHSHSFEILGIIRGLEIAKSKNIEHIISHCDDKTTAKKLKEYFEKGIYGIPKNVKRELFEQVVELSSHFKSLKFEYIPRTQNKYADALSRRYAGLMEENFIRQYNLELDFSELKFSQGQKTKKRIFFSHPSIVRNHNKVNPFLVAQVRNKKIRKISREEQKENYHYLFNEVFTVGENTVVRSFFYNNKNEVILKKDYSVNSLEFNFDKYCDIFSDNFSILKNKIKANQVWVSSNYRLGNHIFEQKEKIHEDLWEPLLKVHKSISGFQKVFFNHLHFEHTYSTEIAPQEKKKKKLDEEIYTLEDLMEKLSQSEFIKDTSKYFGEIIRHQLRNYKNVLERELNSIEINEVIQETVANLKAKGVHNIPQKYKS